MSQQGMTPRRDVSLLIIEDEPRMRELLVRAAESWGFLVTAARTGEEAIRAMESQPSEVLLLDLNLPGMGGMECFEIVRARWPKTQVVVLTGFGDLEAAKKAIHLDVVEFLTKPCHLGELEVALDRACRRLEAREPVPEPELERPPAAEPQTEGVSTLDDLERAAILAALSRHNGNRAATAAELGISLRTLYYRLSEYQRQGYLSQ